MLRDRLRFVGLFIPLAALASGQSKNSGCSGAKPAECSATDVYGDPLIYTGAWPPCVAATLAANPGQEVLLDRHLCGPADAYGYPWFNEDTVVHLDGPNFGNLSLDLPPWISATFLMCKSDGECLRDPNGRAGRSHNKTLVFSIADWAPVGQLAVPYTYEPACGAAIADDSDVLTFEIQNPGDRINIDSSVTGRGRVTSSGVLNCTSDGGTCAMSAVQGSAVTLSAVAEPGWSFLGWSAGCCVGTGAECSVDTSANQTCIAEFEVPSGAARVALNIAGSGAVDVHHATSDTSCNTDCELPVVDGTEPFVFTARPSAGAMLQGWTGDCSVSVADRNIATMAPIDGARCIATFEPGVVLDVEVVNPPGFSGRVLATQGAALDCLDACSVTVAKGTMVTLVGTASQGDQRGFEVSWSEGCASLSGSQVQVPVDTDTLCRATFTLPADPCTTSAPPTAVVTIRDGSGATVAPDADGVYVISRVGALTMDGQSSQTAPGRTVDQWEWTMPDGTNQYFPAVHWDYVLQRGATAQANLQIRDSCGDISQLPVMFRVP